MIPPVRMCSTSISNCWMEFNTNASNIPLLYHKICHWLGLTCCFKIRTCPYLHYLIMGRNSKSFQLNCSKHSATVSQNLSLTCLAIPFINYSPPYEKLKLKSDECCKVWKKINNINRDLPYLKILNRILWKNKYERTRTLFYMPMSFYIIFSISILCSLGINALVRVFFAYLRSRRKITTYLPSGHTKRNINRDWKER